MPGVQLVYDGGPVQLVLHSMDSINPSSSQVPVHIALKKIHKHLTNFKIMFFKIQSPNSTDCSPCWPTPVHPPFQSSNGFCFCFLIS